LKHLLKILLLAICFTSNSAFALFSDVENNKIDSLYGIVENSKEDTSVAKAYYELSDILYTVNLDTILFFCNKANDIIKINLAKSISDSHKKVFFKIQANCYNNIGYVYKKHGDIPKALEYYHSALLTNEKLGNQMGIANLLNNIAVIYESQNDIEKALEYYENSLELFRAINYKKGIATTLNNIGIIYRNFKGKKEKALEYYLEALEIRIKINDKNGIPNSLNNLGYAYLGLNELDKALKYFKESLYLREQLNYKLGIVNSLINIGNVYYNSGDLINAKIYATRTLKISQEEGSPLYIGRASLLLKKIYKKNNNPIAELKMFELYVKMRDSLDNINNKKTVYKQQLQYKYEKQKALDDKETESQLAIAEEKKQKQKVVMLVVSIGLILFLLFTVFLYKRWKITRNQKKIIEIQNEELAKKNTEKEYMMKEIHHRVKNNLQVVNSLLKFQSNEIDDPKIVSMFKNCQNRILSMASVHEQMYRSENLMEIPIDKHLFSLVTDLIKDYNIDTEIEPVINVESIDMGIKTLIPLGLIINEIVSNSIKHAFINRKKGILTVSLRRIDEIRLELITKDDGIGYHDSISQGLGLELIEVFTQQLDGRIEKNIKNGTKYKIIFKDQDK
tara:strand:+ start:445 stop:2307 length:1863 start_codon:yes stop_codon:yes gene_type:complete